MIVRRQQQQIRNIQNSLTASQARLSILEQQKEKDQETINIQS